MSSHEQAIVSLLSNFALSFDGAVLGLTLAYGAIRTIVKFTSSSCGPCSLLSGTEDLVILRGLVEAKSAVEGGTWKSLRQNVLVSQDSGDRAVIVQRTQTLSCIYNESKGFFEWSSDLEAILSDYFLLQVPFVVIDGSQWPAANYVVVIMDGSRHHLPLTTLCHQLQLMNSSLLTHSSKHFLQDEREQQQQQSHAVVDEPNSLAEDESGDVPNGCNLSNEEEIRFWEVSPKCSVCRKRISNSVRILEYSNDFASVRSRVGS
ncbi:hypothetical protein ACJRO7_026218 [Eucalyptus globulus]|uniref:Uncharacterized protein n=1 Tax=Eucalyptus globulus TaxID=34317 RepID=A0ABD3KDP4_EUCGL